MPICTSCKYNRQVERFREDVKRLQAEQERLKAEKERLGEVCAHCKGPSDHFGKDVHIEAADDPILVFREIDSAALFASRAATASHIDVADEKTAELLLRVVAEFASLTDAEAPIVARRLRNQPDYQIAHEMRLSTAVVWERWHHLKKKNPIWGAIDNGLIGKRKGGRKPGEKRTPKGEAPGERPSGPTVPPAVTADGSTADNTGAAQPPHESSHTHDAPPGTGAVVE